MAKMRLVNHSKVLITPLIVLLHHLLNFAVIASMKILDLLLELVDSSHQLFHYASGILDALEGFEAG